MRPTDFREWMFRHLRARHDLQPAHRRRAHAQLHKRLREPVFVSRVHEDGSSGPTRRCSFSRFARLRARGRSTRAGTFSRTSWSIEASVKDEARFPGKWAYFDFGRDMKPQVAALPRTERCYACHADNGAVDNTFVQFYPTLLEVATKMGTVKAVTSAPTRSLACAAARRALHAGVRRATFWSPTRHSPRGGSRRHLEEMPRQRSRAATAGVHAVDRRRAGHPGRSRQRVLRPRQPRIGRRVCLPWRSKISTRRSRPTRRSPTRTAIAASRSRSSADSQTRFRISRASSRPTRRSRTRYYNRGVCYELIGLDDLAIDDISTSIAIEPRAEYRFERRGTIYFRKNLLDEALADYEQALVINPQYASALYGRGIIRNRRRAILPAAARISRQPHTTGRTSSRKWPARASNSLRSTPARRGGGSCIHPYREVSHEDAACALRSDRSCSWPPAVMLPSSRQTQTSRPVAR